MSRSQFTIRALLVLMLAVACFFGGIRLERERKRLEEEAAALAAASNGVKAAKIVPTMPIPIDVVFPATIHVSEIRDSTGDDEPSSDFTRPDSPLIEALELRGFEGMTPRPVR